MGFGGTSSKEAKARAVPAQHKKEARKSKKKREKHKKQKKEEVKAEAVAVLKATAFQQ